ncbi:MAG: response regulator transcription factor [Actinomycetota bacterium]
MTDRALDPDDGPLRVLLVDDQPLVRVGLGRILGSEPGIEVVSEASDGAEALQRLAEATDDAPIDVVVTDVRMRGVDGIETTGRIRAAEGPPVLVLTTFDDDEILWGAIDAGAAGFILKEASPEDLIRATVTVARGGAWLDPEVTARVLAHRRASETDITPTPSPGPTPTPSPGSASASTPSPGSASASTPSPGPTPTPSPSPGSASASTPTTTGADDRPEVRPAATDDRLTHREHEVLVLMAAGRTNGEIAEELYVGAATVKSHISSIFTKLAVRDRAGAIVHAYRNGLVEF